MRTIKLQRRCKRDFKKFEHDRELENTLNNLLFFLANDQPLPLNARDHALHGVWADYRECHITPDLLLIYQKLDPNTLRLARIGSHSELFS